MISNYIGLVQYFQAMPGVIPGIKGVTVGIDEEIANALPSNIAYPHLWVETPDARFTGTDENPSTIFLFSLAIIINEPTQSGAAGNQALSDAMTLMESLYNQMLADGDGDQFDLVLDDNDQEVIRRWTADNAYGWRMNIKIGIPRPLC